MSVELLSLYAEKINEHISVNMTQIFKHRFQKIGVCGNIVIRPSPAGAIQTSACYKLVTILELDSRR